MHSREPRRSRSRATISPLTPDAHKARNALFMQIAEEEASDFKKQTCVNYFLLYYNSVTTVIHVC